ncbi:IclR family transcriptional regulator [Bacillus thermotolerans]|uniref:Glycerol operon regulatory protein n=1 Tax=Bacillus thermotolerans TaxID=1221996 RepID=A0A0F5IBP8_BACTR|nr:IclR family transcriptional regulator [Bacillus thermotolerans]KKB39135.1 Transcriptional regulator KdgR, KDG operon repressor [Bacillus thermotolerans]KKB41578.1 Transcriptional regulator KdgR, KDG operon repressor [Bacillus thermotolerans]KKB42755.1 Transcriptional regulator KdgR, KDG operon repressor [Bacillus thermotolerans]
MERENVVKSVARALDIIELVSSSKQGMGVSEISRQMDINKSSVFRILSTLSQYGYIEQNEETEKYRLGYRFLHISSKLLDSIDVRAEALPILKELESETNEVVHLVVYDQGEVVYIEKLDGDETLRMHSKVGKRAPVHCTSVGKAIMAYLPREEVQSIIERKGLPAHTAHTIVEKEILLNELDEVKKKGYAFDLDENEEGIRCVAAPVFDHTGAVAAAVSISGPTMRMTDDRLRVLSERMVRAGQAISERLGCNS